MYIYIYIYIYVYYTIYDTHICTQYIHTRRIYTCIYIYMYMLYVCIYIYIYTHVYVYIHNIHIIMLPIMMITIPWSFTTPALAARGKSGECRATRRHSQHLGCVCACVCVTIHTYIHNTYIYRHICMI